jgi:hypothetical protein
MGSLGSGGNALNEKQTFGLQRVVKITGERNNQNILALVFLLLEIKWPARVSPSCTGTRRCFRSLLWLNQLFCLISTARLRFPTEAFALNDKLQLV